MLVWGLRVGVLDGNSHVKVYKLDVQEHACFEQLETMLNG